MCVWCVYLCVCVHVHMYMWCIRTQSCVCKFHVTVCPFRAGAVGVVEVEALQVGLQVRDAAEGN